MNKFKQVRYKTLKTKIIEQQSMCRYIKKARLSIADNLAFCCISMIFAIFNRYLAMAVNCT